MGHGESVVNLCLWVKGHLQNLHQGGCLRVLRDEPRGREAGYEWLNQVVMLRIGLIQGREPVVEVPPVGVRVPVGSRVPPVGLMMVAVDGWRIVAVLFLDLGELQTVGQLWLLVVPRVVVD